MSGGGWQLLNSITTSGAAMSQRRLFFTKFPNPALEPKTHKKLSSKNQKWTVKQVNRSNFATALEEIKTHILNSDYIAISLKKTGAFSSPWQKVLPIDTDQTAYLKAKYASEKFQVFQLAVCPFSLESSKVIAYPYNFHLFPRDELKLRMPSYSFSCQSSYLTSMANEGFDFNACIRDGISYLSRAQESTAKGRIENLLPGSFITQFEAPSTYSVADSMFTERIKARLKHWIGASRDSKTTNEDTLLSSLRKMISGNELFGSRPCLTIDVCSERQVLLALEVLKNTVNVVPLLVPSKGGGTQAIRVVLANSENDKDMLEKEIHNMQGEQDNRVRGFRGVIDLVATSQKPIVAHNSLSEFAFIHSKFLSPLPSTIDEFRCSLHTVFPRTVDLNHLMKEIVHVRKVKSLSGALCHLKERTSVPVNMEIHQQGEPNEVRSHGSDVLRISHMFAKLSLMLQVPDSVVIGDSTVSCAIESFTNTFSPGSANFRDSLDNDFQSSPENSDSISSQNLVLLWGFGDGISARKLKELLRDSHDVFSENFHVRLVDKNCAILGFWAPGFARRFLEIMDSGGVCCEPIREMIAGGLRAAGYVTYLRACELGCWDANLPDALEKALEETAELSETISKEDLHVTCWNHEDIIDLDSL